MVETIADPLEKLIVERGGKGGNGHRDGSR
jgi:hypothetical protein